MQKLIKDMQGILPAEQVHDHPALVATYAVDASYFDPKALLVVDVTTLDEVCAVLRVCTAHKIGVTFRGAGTSVSGQACGEGVLVRLKGALWRRIEVLDEGKMFWSGSAVIGIEVNAALAPYQRKMGADPASIASATMGGIIVDNSAGMCCMVDQNCYHAVKGMRMILADGTYLDTTDKESVAAFRSSHAALLEELCDLRRNVLADPAVVERIKRKYSIKNTIGYTVNSFVDYEDPVDILMHLMVGSEGTLGFFHEVLMETIPTPPIRAVGLMFFPSLTVATDAVVAMKGACSIDAAEILNYHSLIAMQNIKNIPDVMKNLQEGACAMLIETKAWNSDELDENVDSILKVLSCYPSLSDQSFTADEVECEKLWDIRRALYPAIATYREADEYVLTEDINIPVSRLAEGCEAFQELFDKHGYPAGIMGHAFHGNLHFSVAVKIADAKEVQRLKDFMDDLVELITGRFDGSLKAEHGTGRAMAPFVRREWGDFLFEVMCSVKKVLDPESILNPGVVISDDSNAHINGLKSPVATHPDVDLCVECGFCEQVCPSRNIGLTPRQRISLARAIVKFRMDGQDDEADEWDKIFRKYGEQLCATDGLCKQRCPLGVDVAGFIRDIRGKNVSDKTLKLADYVTGHMGSVLKNVSTALNVMSVAQRIVGDAAMGSLSSSARKLSNDRLPLWNKAMPAGAVKALPELKTGTGAQRVVYFSSCAVRTMGRSRGDKSEPLMDVTVRLLERAGYEVVFPKNMESLCCGKAMETKGLAAQADELALKLGNALLEASGNGKDIILCDTSPCLARMKKTLDKRLTMMDPIEFTMKYVADRLDFKKLPRTVALHPTCSTRTMGLEGQFRELAAKCVENVVIPKGVNCCGFSGDKGFHNPELNASALENLKGQIEHCDEGYSVSRTCEIGLTLHGGKNYRNILYLVEEATR
ncbi:FAD-binding and (Fe-S)-binding domain-containing protein [Maridesulfovibrio zosterae]|uniref:FAD-binding and (Fe-S)-binding domain-containing protein n=1 Tax=Maridesulfovibrio zosterae TaxID=82171 RepID=UPI00041EC8FD|nr:FAD-binding and (Fe-S)-binding domain-containing protein [Maridesulfovibrio zosterae]